MAFLNLAPRRLALAAAVLITGCATTGIESPDTFPGPRLPPDLSRPGQPGRETPPATSTGTPGTNQPAAGPLTPPAVAAPSEREIKSMIGRLLPGGIKDRSGWVDDLYNAFAALGLPHAAPVYCTVIAVTEQESSFQADPVVPGLPAIVWRELETRGARYGVPSLLISAAMLKNSPDGRSYKQRIDSLRTEKELNRLFEDMISELPFGKQLFVDQNPVRTAGPMQVSIAFAEEHARERRYPYPIGGSLREEVFTRRGGLYFGSAILLDYPAPYTEVVYRFADFNAGRFSSRNAAFQSALAWVAGKPLTLDGDLMRYAKGKPVDAPSTVESTLRSLGRSLRLSDNEIRRDLLLEKTAAFSDSPVYTRLFALAEQRAGRPLTRQVMPQIDLKSPKITRKLTTEWFAQRVEGRFRTCLGRNSS